MPGAAPSPPLKVVLVEDSPLLRQAIADLLGELGGVEVVGGAADEATAIDLVRRQRPDLAIVDLQLREGSGLGVLHQLARHPERFGRPRTVVFSGHARAGVRERCFALGVERVFDKATELDALLAYVRQAVAA